MLPPLRFGLNNFDMTKAGGDNLSQSETLEYDFIESNEGKQRPASGERVSYTSLGRQPSPYMLNATSVVKMCLSDPAVGKPVGHSLNYRSWRKTDPIGGGYPWVGDCSNKAS